MTDADQAAARVEAFLPVLADIPDEFRSAQLGVQRFADDVRFVFDDRELLRAEVERLRGHDANLLARELADRTDALATVRQQFDDFRDTCSEHSADRCVEQVRLEDAEAALVRYGNEMMRLCEAAKAFRAERDELRAEVERLTRQRDEAREQLPGLKQFAPNEDGQRFEPGHLYRADNDCFEFLCERIVGGIALGIENRIDGRAGFIRQRVYHSVMVEGCWRDVTAEPPQAQETVRDGTRRAAAGPARGVTSAAPTTGSSATTGEL